ncbi:MAG: starch-binding protein [Ruminococcus sp.]|nr:starch-binding protein [Ruminococcus sp.]
MKRSKRLLSALLALLMVVSVMLVGMTTATAATASISYSFTKTTAGYAQGTITITPTAGNYGKYFLYWANDTKALEGYGEIGSVSISSGSGKVTMPAQTAIPADATKVIAFKASSEPAVSSRTVANASAVYAIPASRQLSFDSADALYTFGAISDPQLANDSYGSGTYPNDETHLAAAFESLSKREVDFIVSSGDTVNDQDGNRTYAAEYKRYQKILADSSYANPIYEAIGNHDVGTVWNKNGGYYNANEAYIKGTGLDSTAETLKAGKPYFEITEPTTGDHFIFMALEGGFYTDRGTQFSKAQLDWLEGLLKKYYNDGKNIFIIEHANVQGWGSGDKLTTPYYYDLGLNPANADVKRFVTLMETYKECVIITGHTHLELSAQYNYSDNNGTSAVMMHNSAIGGVRWMDNGSVNRDDILGLSEGYIVEVYEDCILFNGANLYYNEIMPTCSYIIPFSTFADEKVTEPKETTTDAPIPTVTEPKTTTAPKVTDPEPTTIPTPTETQPIDYLYGDADLNKKINVKDATLIQKYAAELEPLEGIAFTQANVSGDKAVNVRDATYIQKFVAGLIVAFPIERIDDLADVGADDKTLAKSALDKYYEYSSYDQYMALKKAYKYNIIPTGETIATLIADLEAIVSAAGGSTGGSSSGGGDITVYFTNNENWSTVNAYVWGSGGTMSSWPGSPMTYVKTNDMNQKIYSVSFSFSDYQNIIFNNGSTQTVDIALSGSDNVGYYISGESGGKLTCETYTFTN